MRFLFALFLPAILALVACQTTTPTNCKAYLATETREQAQAIVYAIANGSTPLRYNQQIVGAVDANGKIVGCDPR